LNPLNQFSGLGANLFNALSSISRNDDLKCVSRILCEMASEKPPGKYKQVSTRNNQQYLEGFGKNVFTQSVFFNNMYKQYIITYDIFHWLIIALLFILPGGSPDRQKHLPYWVLSELPFWVTAAMAIRSYVIARSRGVRVIPTNWCIIWTIIMADSSNSSAKSDTEIILHHFTLCEVENVDLSRTTFKFKIFYESNRFHFSTDSSKFLGERKQKAPPPGIVGAETDRTGTGKLKFDIPALTACQDYERSFFPTENTLENSGRVIFPDHEELNDRPLKNKIPKFLLDLRDSDVNTFSQNSPLVFPQVK